MNKTVVILDCFVHNERIKSSLRKRLKSLKERNMDVILASNTIITDKDIIEDVKYFIYNSNENLFCENYTGISYVDFWSSHGWFSSHTLEPGNQRHGLSVIINMLSSLNLAKQMGYTHFHKMEVDADFTDKDLDSVLEIDKKITGGEIDGVIYLHEPEGDFWIGGDVAFSYISCDIETFLKNYPHIGCEQDYINFLLERKNNLDFLIAEEFLYEILKNKTSDKTILKKSVPCMIEDFPETRWNTVTTPSLKTNLEGAITGVYKKINNVGENIGFCLYSRNLSDLNIVRNVKVFCGESDPFYITQHVPYNSSWAYNDLPESATHVEIYSEDGRLLLEQGVNPESAFSYLQFD